jgi:hypothetical protein
MKIPNEKFLKFPLFNPLDKITLGKNVADHLLSEAPFKMPPPAFHGSGIYAIYYQGEFPYYRKFVGKSPEMPLYIGKAIPDGARKGGQTVSAESSIAVLRRLREHAKSIEQVSNLKIDDFYCRFLIVDDIWIPLAESILIERFSPIWNTLIEGFGIHDPGAGRRLQKKSIWDTLHPGRKFAEGLPDNSKADNIIRGLQE